MLPGVEAGCSHVAMSSGEHEDEHEEVLSGVAAMESATACAPRWRDFSRISSQRTELFSCRFSQRLHALTPARIVSALSL